MWIERIQEFIGLPDDLHGAKVAGRYRGAEATGGPDRSTPLTDSLCDKHVSGLYTIVSGAIAWGVPRVGRRADTRLLSDLSVALFCLQQHPAYFSAPESRASLEEIDEADRWTGPILYFLDEWFDHRIRSHEQWPVLPPHHLTGGLVTVMRFLLGAEHRPLYDEWVGAIVERMNRLVPFPGHATVPLDATMAEWPELSAISMGPALPPHVLDRSTTPDPAKFEDQKREFLGSVNWESNVFLRSPDEIGALGFEGIPYETVR
ncbi:MAG: hypothetical protein JJ863_02090 [Deltaproteobacteria bacterium]|nr:hypothetical protein [Deltaproteobacteria bacterium]